MKRFKALFLSLSILAALQLTTIAQEPSEESDPLQEGVVFRQILRSKKADGLTVTLLQKQNGAYIPVDPNKGFKAGDEIKISFNSNFNGYIYLVNVAPSGQQTVIFPGIREGNNVRDGEAFFFGPFDFDDEKGLEVIQVVLSQTTIPNLEQAARYAEGKIANSTASAVQNLSSSSNSSSSNSNQTGIVTENINNVLPEGVVTRQIRVGKAKDLENPIIVNVSRSDSQSNNGNGANSSDSKLNSKQVIAFELRLQHF